MKLADDEVQRFLRRAMVARIATLSRSGRPSVTPLYFHCTGEHLWLGTSSWTLAAREVQSGSRVSVLFQVERDPREQRILRVSGSAVVRTDAETLRASNRAQAFKYLLSPVGLWHQVLHLHLTRLVRQYRAQNGGKGGVPCVIAVNAEQVEFI
jgi:hypothetical protein